MSCAAFSFFWWSCSMRSSIKICKFIISQKPIFTSIAVCHSNSLLSLPLSSCSLFLWPPSFCSVNPSSLPPPKHQMPVKETRLVLKGQFSSVNAIRESNVEKTVRVFVGLFTFLPFTSLLSLNNPIKESESYFEDGPHLKEAFFHFSQRQCERGFL